MRKLSAKELEPRLDFSEHKCSILLRKLAGKRVEDDNFGWIIADLMTLLLIFFILFYSNQLDQTASAVAAAKSAVEKFSSRTVFEWLIPNRSIPAIVKEEPLPQDPPVPTAFAASPMLGRLRADIERAAGGAGEAVQIREEDPRYLCWRYRLFGWGYNPSKRD